MGLSSRAQRIDPFGVMEVGYKLASQLRPGGTTTSPTISSAHFDFTAPATGAGGRRAGPSPRRARSAGHPGYWPLRAAWARRRLLQRFGLATRPRGALVVRRRAHGKLLRLACGLIDAGDGVDARPQLPANAIL